MNIKEAAGLLVWKPEQIVAAIEIGIELPKSNCRIKLLADCSGIEYDITDSSLDDFISAFEQEEPGRHPPIKVRRSLLVESGHRCAICEDSAPLQFHHILEYSQLKHHDPAHMLAVCGTCHSKISVGQIDYQAQREYKDRLQARWREVFPSQFPARFSWDDLQEVITALHSNLAIIDPSMTSKYDFSDVDIKQKNLLNGLGADYFIMMRDYHEPYFGRIERFLKAPINVAITSLYHEIVDELRSKIAAEQGKVGHFEDVLILIYDTAKNVPGLRDRRSALNILLSFMYFNCDIGRKS